MTTTVRELLDDLNRVTARGLDELAKAELHKAEIDAIRDELGRLDLPRLRLGGRNYLRVGDLVRVLPSKPGKRDGYVGRVTRIYLTRSDDLVVDVWGGPPNRSATRTFRPERLARTQRQEATR